MQALVSAPRTQLGAILVKSDTPCEAAGSASVRRGCDWTRCTRLNGIPLLGHQAFFSLRNHGGKNRIRGLEAIAQGGGDNGKPPQSEDVVIVGGGLCGLATALALHKVGIRSVVLEQGESLRETGTTLTVWGNGWRALDVLGVADGLRRQFSDNDRIEILDKAGRVLRGFNLSTVPNGPYEVRTVERKELLKALSAPLPDGTIRFNSKVVSISQKSEGYTQVELEDGTVHTTKVLVGCDGLRSVVGTWMNLPEPRYAGQIAIRGVAVYQHNSSENYIRTVLGRGTRSGYLVVSPTKIYWFVVFNAASRGARVVDPNVIKQEAISLLKDFPSFMIDAVNNTPPATLTRNALWDRWTLPYRSQVQNGVILAGDAAHPMTPNLGQGGCCALEDGVVLARELHRAFVEGATPASIADSLEIFSRLRWERKMPLVVRSNIMGKLLQIGFEPIRFVRDEFVIPRISPVMLTNHTLFDCGELPGMALETNTVRAV